MATKSREDTPESKSESNDDEEPFLRWSFPQPKIFREKTDRASVCVILRSTAKEGYSERARESPQQLMLESEMLLLRRAVTARDKFPGQLCFPGGHLEAGETVLEAAMRECYEECALDMKDSSKFAIAGRLEDRNIGILTISSLVFVQITPHSESQPLQLQRSEVDSCVWASMKLFIQKKFGGTLRKERTDMDFYKFIPRLFRGLVQNIGFTMLDLPAVYVSLQTGGWRCSVCDAERRVRKIRQGHGSCDREKTLPLPTKLSNDILLQQKRMIGLIGTVPQQTLAYESLPLFGLSLGVINSINLAVGFEPVLSFDDIKWKSPVLFGFKTLMAYSMYGSDNPRWRNWTLPRGLRSRRPKLQAVFGVAPSAVEELKGNVVHAGIVEPALEARMTALDRTGVTILSASKWDATRYVLAANQQLTIVKLRDARKEAIVKGDRARQRSLESAISRIQKRESRRLQRKISRKNRQIERERRNRQEDARIARRRKGESMFKDFAIFMRKGSKRVHPKA